MKRPYCTAQQARLDSIRISNASFARVRRMFSSERAPAPVSIQLAVAGFLFDRRWAESTKVVDVPSRNLHPLLWLLLWLKAVQSKLPCHLIFDSGQPLDFGRQHVSSQENGIEQCGRVLVSMRERVHAVPRSFRQKCRRAAISRRHAVLPLAIRL